MHRRVMAIVNPVSGEARGMELARTLSAGARTLGVDVSIRPTARPGEESAFAKTAAAEGFDAVMAIGGDGTLHKVVNGLGVGGPPLLVVPMGTGNAFAREIGASARPRACLSALRKFRVVARDVGVLADGRLFLCYLGAGYDAVCAKAYAEQRDRGIGALKYVAKLARIMVDAVPRADFSALTLRVDGAAVTSGLSYVLAANSPYFGGPLRFVRHAYASDGRFDFLAVRDRVTYRTVGKMMRLGLFGWRWPGARFVSGTSFSLSSAETNVPYQTDGEFAGYLPVEARILPGGMQILSP